MLFRSIQRAVVAHGYSLAACVIIFRHLPVRPLEMRPDEGSRDAVHGGFDPVAVAVCSWSARRSSSRWCRCAACSRPTAGGRRNSPARPGCRARNDVPLPKRGNEGNSHIIERGEREFIFLKTTHLCSHNTCRKYGHSLSKVEGFP